MDIEILVVPDCQHAAPATGRVLDALDRAGLSARVTETVIESPAVAEARGMRGSPTILVDGRDPFASDGDEPGSISCRLYSSEDGLSGLPSVDQLIAVLAGDRSIGARVD
jgi:hypothetical protein